MSERTDETQVVGQRVLAGRWRVEGRLGAGGMGSVLRAFDLVSGQPVAIKMLALELVDRPEFVTRFEREARLLARLNHPALVPLIAVDKAEGTPFFVMKLIEGTTLERLLKERTRLTVRQALPLVQQLAAALDFLHARGVVHRDLKPANVMVDANEHVTLVDFGISQQSNTTRLTLPGLVVGTPLYMAPEQILADEAGPPADIYSLALLTWHLLVGTHPFAGDRRESLFTLQVKEMPKLAHEQNPHLPVPLSEAIQRSLDKDPTRRHASASAFYEDLVRSFGVDSTTSSPDAPTAPDGAKTRGDKPAALANAATVAKLEPTSAVPSPAPRPFPWLWVALGVGGLALLVALGWSLS